MSLPFEIEEELQSLIDLLLDNEISEAQQERLQTILREEAHATAFYVAYMKLSADLYRLSEEQIPPAAEELAFVPTRSRSSIDWVSTAVACLLLGFFGMVLHGAWPNIKQRMPYLQAFESKPLSVSYAKVIEAQRTTWTLGGAVAGQALGADTCVLEEGIVKLQFESNVRAVIQGPATFRIDRDNQLQLEAGKAVAVVPPEATGFTVHTPDAEIIDLGTEFGVKVDEGRDTEVHVFKGKVEASLINAAEMLALTQGEAARFTGNTQRSEKLDQADLALFDPPSTPLAVTPAAPAPPLYLERFDGPEQVHLATQRPDHGMASWKATPSARADGSLSKEENVAALLPFVPEDGHRYCLSVVLSSSTNPQPFDSSFMLGFTRGSSLAMNHKDSRRWTDMTTAVAKITYLSNHQVFTHPTPTIGAVDYVKLKIADHQPIEHLPLEIILDTRGPAWQVEWKAGDMVKTYTFPTRPEIDHISFGTQTFDGQVSELRLEVD